MPRLRLVRGQPPPTLVTGANGGGALPRGVKGAAQSHRSSNIARTCWPKTRRWTGLSGQERQTWTARLRPAEIGGERFVAHSRCFAALAAARRQPSGPARPVGPTGALVGPAPVTMDAR